MVIVILMIRTPSNPQMEFMMNKYFSCADEGVYNTYVLDSDYKSWALLMHCAEQSKSPRYLSSFIMSREPSLGVNVISYLREKLPRLVTIVIPFSSRLSNICATYA